MLAPVIGGHCMTEHFSGRRNVLITTIEVSQGFDNKTCPVGHPKDLQKVTMNALWDTGATNSAITQKIVDSLGLAQTGIAQIHGVHGMKSVPTYNVAFHLPNNVIFTSLVATLGEITGADVLVGMDVIGAGDFAVTHHNGHTTMSLRMPSTECIDFLARAKRQPEKNPHNAPPIVVKIPTKYEGTPRNAQCPCGSGKKFKLCCEGKVA